jgi:hypothetical protein
MIGQIIIHIIAFIITFILELIWDIKISMWWNEVKKHGNDPKQIASYNNQSVMPHNAGMQPVGYQPGMQPVGYQPGMQPTGY